MKKLLRTLISAALALALSLANSALAGGTPLTNDFTYQGLLREATGNPATGDYDFQFSLWEDQAGSAQIGSTGTHLNVAVANGIFTVPLNFGLGAFDGNQRWLKIAVRPALSEGGFTDLAPLQPLLATPYAHFALNAGLLPPVYNPAVEFNNAANTYVGSASRMLNGKGTSTVELIGGAGEAPGVIQLRNAAAFPTVHLAGDFAAQGAQIASLSEDGWLQFHAAPDLSAGDQGLFLTMSRNNSAPGFVFDGNSAGSLNPRIDFSGTVSNMTFNTNAAGDASVILPASAIAATEILDEPGVANIMGTDSGVFINTTLTTIASRSITVPGPGFVIAFAQGDLNFGHITGTATNIYFGVSDDASVPSNQDIQVVLPASLPTGIFDFPASAHGLFSVASAGTFTYQFFAQKLTGGGTAIMFDINLTLIYFPTAYGVTVSNSPPAAMRGEDNTGNDLSLPASPGLTNADIAAEQNEAAAFHEARMAAEFQQMRLQLQQMQIRLAQLEQEQASGRWPAGSAAAAPR